MSAASPYLALLVLPVAFIFGFAFNPIEFAWSFRHGREPMPGELPVRAASVRRGANFLGDALILGLIVLLQLKHPIPTLEAGLTLSRWGRYVGVGVAAPNP